MKLLIFSDIHANYSQLEQLMNMGADLYFAGGDLVNWNRNLESVGPILARRAEKMYVLPGNHESHEAVQRLCADYGLHDFHGQTLEAGGYKIAGLGYSNPTPFDTPGEYSEDELAQRLDSFSDMSPLILICHCPPKDTPLDRVREGQHFGSTAVRDFIKRSQPEYFFCGHIHEAAGTEATLDKTLGRNVGSKGYLLEI